MNPKSSGVFSHLQCGSISPKRYIVIVSFKIRLSADPCIKNTYSNFLLKISVFSKLTFYLGRAVTLERLRNENEDKAKTQMTQSFNQYSENETEIWRQNIPDQFNHVSSSCLRSHFVISLP